MTITTRDKIISAAQMLLQTRSFSGFSFEDLAKRVGIRKPSLYHHFKTKNELGVAILDRVNVRLEAASHSRADIPAVEQLRGYLAAMAEYLGAGERICPGGAFIANWDEIPRSIRQEVRHLREIHNDWLTRILEKGKVDKSIAFNGRTVGDVARWIFATMQGALILARASGSREDYDIVAAQLAAALTPHNS